MIKPSERVSSIEEYYFSKRGKDIAEVRATGKEIINFSIGNPDLPPADSVVEKLYESAKNPNNHGYQSYSGLPELRSALAEWYKKVFNVSLDSSSELLPLLGSKEGIFHISMSFLNPGDIALVPNPSYAPYKVATHLAGGKAVFYDLDENNNWLPDLENIDKKVADNAKIMWVNYPNMPTGAIAEKEDLQKVVDFAARHNLLLCNDNPYSLVLPKRKPLSVLALDGGKDVCIELNSLSKSHNMAGWRVGMVAGNPNYIEPILKFMSNINTGMFRPIQEGAIEALLNVPDSFHDERNAVYQKRKDLVFEIVEMLKLKADKNTSGMFVWAKVPDNLQNVDEFVDTMLYKLGIVLTPGKIFGSNGERFVRFSLGVKENEILKGKKVIEENLNLFSYLKAE